MNDVAHERPIGDAATATVAVQYFDGQTARARSARLRVTGDAIEVIDAASGALLQSVPRSQVQWPERQRHGPRVAHFEPDGMVQGDDSAAWDAFARVAGARESLVVRAQQHWRATLAACAALLVMLAAGYLWGLPWASRAVVALVPASVDREIGRVVLQSVEGRWLSPSELPAAEQQRLRTAFARAVDAAWPEGQRPTYELRFAKSDIGPNAFALPGGTMILTDEMVKLVDAREDVIVGVLGHELGHVRQRHGMRMLVQFTVLNVVTGVALGDFSGALAAAPAILGQRAYSRDHEREADAESLRILRAGGHSPEAMVVLFEKIAAWRNERTKSAEKAGRFDPGIALSSHPADEERIRFFRDAAAAR
jgi:Zn-dependent protease with chaperone function